MRAGSPLLGTGSRTQSAWFYRAATDNGIANDIQNALDAGEAFAQFDFEFVYALGKGCLDLNDALGERGFDLNDALGERSFDLIDALAQLFQVAPQPAKLLPELRSQGAV